MIRKYIGIMALLAASVTAYGASKLTPTDDNPEKVVVADEEEATGDMSEADHIIISKESMRLKLYDKDDLLICSFPVAIGKHLGDKQELGDMKTPEGEFSIVQIQRASHWMYNTAKENIKGYYGNWFIRLNTKYSGIGIHGTHEPELIGQRSTEGSIRLDNYHLDSLRAMIDVGMVVRIESSRLDREADGKSGDSEPEVVAEEIHPIADDNATPVIEERSEEVVAEVVTPEPEQKQEVEPAAEEKKAKEVEEIPNDEVWHTIKDGELVGRIAASYGVSLAEIKRLNPNLNVDRVSIGQRIKIRGKAPESSEPKEVKNTTTTESGEVWHTVVQGDLLGRIAIKYDTSIKQIKSLNPGLNPDRISIGQKIRVK